LKYRKKFEGKIKMSKVGRVSKAMKAKAVELIAAGYTQSETARQVGIGRATITRWTNDAEFESAVETAVAENADALRHRLQASMDRAYNALVEVLSSDNHNAKVRAAIALLTAGGYLHEQAAQAPGDIEIKLGTRDAKAPAEPAVAQLAPIQPGQRMPGVDPDAKPVPEPIPIAAGPVRLASGARA
jgi:transposase-like protein